MLPDITIQSISSFRILPDAIQITIHQAVANTRGLGIKIFPHRNRGGWHPVTKLTGQLFGEKWPVNSQYLLTYNSYPVSGRSPERVMGCNQKLKESFICHGIRSGSKPGRAEFNDCSAAEIRRFPGQFNGSRIDVRYQNLGNGKTDHRLKNELYILQASRISYCIIA